MVSGRTLTVDWKRPEYFREYYHLTNVPVICACGCTINKRQLSQHKKTKKHFYMLKTVEKEAREIESEALSLGINEAN